MDSTIFASGTSARRRLSVHTRCHGRMVFPRQQVSQDDDLYIVMGQACLQQRDILHDRIVLAITAMGLQSFEGRAPMNRHTPFASSLVGVMARSTARLIRPTRARPERPAPSATISRKFCAAAGHASCARERA